ncbi:wall-associated receptor kinase 5-like [Magnolia sinica]|uniref:wall-associated receptor kinase 5-like n=1 Tax=Magnolia sinica TaxID=86752 RepID=UPI00265B2F6C|nr:wall-associated receptor kinase 5-like [Magnolia sinica]
MAFSATFSYYFLLSLLVITCNFPILVASNLGSYNPNCEKRCGDVRIPFPFGVGDGCFLPGFEVTCRQGIPFLAQSNLSILQISEDGVHVDSTPFISTYIFSNSSYQEGVSIILPENSPYTFSDSNRFVTVGCNAWGLISQDPGQVPSSCISRCNTRDSVVNGSCTGHGCCQVTLPRIHNELQIMVFLAGPNKGFLFNMPSYGFVVEDGGYVFNISDLWDFNRNISMKLDWAIGNGSCSAMNDSSSYPCGENSYCIESKRNYGYLCKCRILISAALLDAKIREKFMCARSYLPEQSLELHLCLPSWDLLCLLSILLLILCSARFYWVQRKRNLKNLKATYFHQNGGLLLQQFSSSNRGTAMKHTKIFSAREVKKATGNYDATRIIGIGSQGTIYKGTLEDGSLVAIKKSRQVAHWHVNQFINELVILTQIGHNNIAKLLGCCLETQVPFLVYEFISNHTLYQKLYGDADVKSSSILLDENCSAKLADFGVSRLIPLDESWILTVIKGTPANLDPEYFKTGNLTEKSDVYSFGVVLVELFYGKMIKQELSPDYNSLCMHFLSCVEGGNLIKILDEGMLREGGMEDLQAIAMIAQRCLCLNGEKRPTMKKVVEELSLMRRGSTQVPENPTVLRVE